MPDAASVLGQAQTKYGVNDLQQKVASLRGLTGNLTNAIAAVDPSVTGRTAGTLTTEGQRSALVSRERAPVVQQLGTANDALTTTGNDLKTADTNARSEADMTVGTAKDKAAKLLQTYQLANDREQAAAKAKADADARAQAQANADRDFAEQQRQYNASQATTRGSASYSGGSSKAPSAADQKAAVAQHVAQGLAGSTGKDGYVSEETFAAALNDYQAAGLGSVRQFWQAYGRFTNPKYVSTYAGYHQR